MIQPNEALPLELLRCPRCGGPFATRFACASCAGEFPSLDGIPWLFPAPEAMLGEWRVRCRALLAELEAQAARYRGALSDAVVRSSTRTRLKLLAAACSDHARRLATLLAPLEPAPAPTAAVTYRALASELPTGQGPASYYANVHRDWCWGEAENVAARADVDRALGDHPCRRVLVPGAGAGRLAYDLHRARRPQATLAVDLNPLLLLVARRMYAGEGLELYEFPVAPRDLASHALLRALRAPEAAPPGLHLLFADVARAPFAAGAFDTVVTPWLIDVLDEDLATFARRLNGWLEPGGRWVDSGTLFFQHADAVRSYSTEEVRELLADAGFEIVAWQESRLPYLASPASRHARLESVVSFAAVKRAEVAVPAAHDPTPAWLARSDVPVPLLPEVSSHVLAMRIHAYVASLVDGRRSVADIAAELVRERLMRADEAEPAVREFLGRVFEEARRPRQA